MPRPNRNFGLALLTFGAFWTVSTLVDLGFHSGVTFLEWLFSPPPHEIQIRLLGGFALAACLYLFLSARDRQLAAQDELTLQKNLYQQLTESSPDCIMVHVDEKIVFANLREVVVEADRFIRGT